MTTPPVPHARWRQKTDQPWATPAQDVFWLDNHQAPAPARPQPRKEHPEQPIENMDGVPQRLSTAI
jgi:hypothetical protein